MADATILSVHHAAPTESAYTSLYQYAMITLHVLTKVPYLIFLLGSDWTTPHTQPTIRKGSAGKTARRGDTVTVVSGPDVDD